MVRQNASNLRSPAVVMSGVWLLANGHHDCISGENLSSTLVVSQSIGTPKTDILSDTSPWSFNSCRSSETFTWAEKSPAAWNLSEGLSSSSQLAIGLKGQNSHRCSIQGPKKDNQRCCHQLSKHSTAGDCDPSVRCASRRQHKHVQRMMNSRPEYLRLEDPYKSPV